MVAYPSMDGSSVWSCSICISWSLDADASMLAFEPALLHLSMAAFASEMQGMVWSYGLTWYGLVWYVAYVVSGQH